MKRRYQYALIGMGVVPLFAYFTVHGRSSDVGLLHYIAPMAVGAVAGFLIGFLHDRIRDHLQQMHDILDAAVFGMLQCNAQGEILFANRSICNSLNVHEKDLLGHVFWENIRDPLKKKELQESFSTLVRLRIRPAATVISLLSPGGSKMKAELHWSYQHYGGDKGIYVATLIDVGSQLRSQHLLNRFAQVVEHTKELVLITDSKGTIEYVNPALVSMTGYSPDELLGKKSSILNSAAQNDSYYKEMWSAISAGKRWSGSLVDRRKDGSFYPVESTIQPIFGDSNEIVAYVNIQHDQSETRELEEQLRQEQKMGAIGTMLGGVAHDVNNVVEGIMANVSLAKRKSKDNGDVIQQLSDIEKLGGQATEMIRQLLSFARNDSPGMKRLALNSFLGEAFRLTSFAAPKDVRLDLHLPEEKIFVKGESTQLQQVILNLVNNASDAVEDCENPEITITLEPFVANNWFKEKHGLEQSFFARLSVKDNGHGIAPEKLDKVFKPFFTTKRAGQGTGLGLAVVARTIEMHGGVILVSSEQENGCVFHIYLPAEEMVDHKQAEACGERRSDDDQTILLVDDQTDIRGPVAESLRMSGYKVLEAGDGQEGVDMYRSHQPDIDLLITDIQMPVKNGIDQVREIRHLCASVPVLFMTGNDKEDAHKGIAEFSNSYLISKPFPFHSLDEYIARLLLESSEIH